MNLIYRDSLWCVLVGEMPIEPRIKLSEVTNESELSDYSPTEWDHYQKAIEAYKAAAVPFAAEEQEKVNHLVWANTGTSYFTRHTLYYKNWKAEPGKIYELRGYEFEEIHEMCSADVEDGVLIRARIFPSTKESSAHSFTEGDERGYDTLPGRIESAEPAPLKQDDEIFWYCAKCKAKLIKKENCTVDDESKLRCYSCWVKEPQEGQELSPRVARLLIQLRDQLVVENIQEAYHLLYQVGSPNFDKYSDDVWKNLESIADITRKAP